MPTELDKFAALFKVPTVEAIYALTPKEFERFVAYVLGRAGYQTRVVGLHFLRGVDLEVRSRGSNRIVAGIECKRYAPEQLVTTSTIRGVRGAPAVDRAGAKPFVITTSDFNKAAHQMAETGARRVYLMNGMQLVRYIDYVRNSRNDDEETIATISPEHFAGRESVRPRRVGDTRILTIANNKGGVGKTTTAYYLGVELAKKYGKRVLLIDLDGQGNLTERCLPDQVEKRTIEGELFPNITHYFAGERHLVDLITPTATDHLSIIPADPFLTLRDYGGNGRPNVELQFVQDVHKICTRQIASLGGPPDWIIIDTPPAMTVFTRSGLCAAEYVIAPLRPRRSSEAGTRNMLTTLRTVSALMGTEADFMGGLITHWDNLELSKEVVLNSLSPMIVRNGGRILEHRVPIDNQLEMLQPGAGTNGAKAYSALAEEVLNYAK